MKKILTVFLLFLSVCAFSQTTGTFTNTTVKMNAGGTTWNALVKLPASYSTSTATYGLLIVSHGDGETGSSTANLTRLISTSLAEVINNGYMVVRGTDSLIVLCPQSNTTPYGWSQMQYILADALTKWRINPLKIYLTGYSRGGGATCRAACNDRVFASSIAAILPVETTDMETQQEYDSILAVTRTRGVAVRCINGSNSALYNIGYNFVQRVNQGSPAVSPLATFWEIAGGGHNEATWNVCYDTSRRFNGKNWLEWLLTYSRTAPAGTPSASAGNDQSITLPTSSIVITGSATAGTGQTITSTVWTRISGPNTPTLSGSTTTTLTIGATGTAMVTGTYVYRLTVTNNASATATDDVTIIVNAHQSPTITMGGQQNVTSTGASISGSATAYNGTTISSYAWTKLSGPSATITSASSASSAVTLTSDGTYVFQLLATDSYGSTVTGTQTIVKSSIPVSVTRKWTIGMGEYVTYLLDNTTKILYNSIGSVESGLPKMSNVSQQGFHHFCAVDTGGYVWVKGDNDLGQLGLGNKTDQGSWARINTDSTGAAFSGVAEAIGWVDAGEGIVFRKIDGTIWITGNVANGISGNNRNSGIFTKPTQISIPGGRLAEQVIVSKYLLVRCTDGTVWACGSGASSGYYALMGTNNSDYNDLKQVILPTTAVDIASGGMWSTALLSNGKLYGWGFWSDYLGRYPPGGDHNEAGTVITPEDFTDDFNAPLPIINIACNNLGTYAILSDSTLWVVGDNVVGNLGIGFEYPMAEWDPPYNWGWENSQLMVYAARDGYPGKHNWSYLPDGIPAVFSMWAQDSDGNLYSCGRNKAGVLGNNILFAGDGSIEAEYPNSIDQPTWMKVNPVGQTNFYSTSPLCITTPSGSPCNTFTIPANTAPIANAGSDLTILSGNITLNGASSSDPNGKISYYKWEKVSGPGGDVIENSTMAVTRVTGLTNGPYVYRLTVTDNGWTTSSDLVQVTVGNQSPVVDAGSNQTIQLPTSSVTLAGSAMDPDGTILSNTWSFISGPVTPTITTPSSYTSTVTGLSVAGTYTLLLSATDNANATATDFFTITVLGRVSTVKILKQSSQ